ncbi:hypothetical protein LTR95_019463, partial [Oleoguttula sp. CCFEE 5521]
MAASLDDIEAYMRDVHRHLPKSRFRVRTTLFLVIDEEGLDADEIVLCNREYVLESHDYEEKFRRVRVPIEEAHTMFVNLDVANMDFEDFVDDDEGPDEDGWWDTHASILPPAPAHDISSRLHPPNMTGLVFVTAPTDLKALNRALTFLRDWEYGDGAFVQTIITTRNAYELEPAAGYLAPTLVPLLEGFDNAWVNASLADIEAYMLDTHRSIARYNARINTTLFLVLDSEALAKDEIVLYKRFYDFASGTYLDKFKITRLPLEQAHAMHANLDINNMEFESY